MQSISTFNELIQAIFILKNAELVTPIQLFVHQSTGSSVPDKFNFFKHSIAALMWITCPAQISQSKTGLTATLRDLIELPCHVLFKCKQVNLVELKKLLCCAACIEFVCSMHGFYLLLVAQVRIPVLILGGPRFFVHSRFCFLAASIWPTVFDILRSILATRPLNHDNFPKRRQSQRPKPPRAMR